MAAERRGQSPLRVSLPSPSPNPSSSPLPSISALFLITFDHRTGYTIIWKRALHGLEIEGDVEYKSLPSGLHTVKNDLVYFVHGKHAGLSAFISADVEGDGDENRELRGARQISVGVLVPGQGRLGRAWLHAEGVRGLASKLAIENPDFKLLDEYWNAHRLRDGSSASQLQSEIPPSPSSLAFLLPSTSRRLGGARDRVDSQASSIPHTLAPHHPAWSLTTLLDTFGPLIFPIYRAALARKRILINCHAPVRQACDFVYDLSVLSNIPLAASSLLSEEAPAKRSRPLFNIGVHDIPLLERDHTAALKRASGEYADGEEDEDNDLGRGWIACTTDGILAMKTQLYDVLVTLPPTYAQDAKSHSWPKVESTGKVLKATQRDLRRFQNLSWALSRSSKPTPSQPSTATATNGSQVAKLQRSTTSTSVIDTLVAESPNTTLPDTDTIVEPLSWTALAYNGFLWWASAGEGAIALNDETESDSALLEGLEPTTPRSNGRRRTLSSSNLLSSTGERDESAKKELALIAYFHRLTTQILSEMAGMVEQTDTDVDDDVPFVLGEEQEDQDVVIRRGDLIRMGLDEWSTADREWVVEMMGNYFGRGARMEGEVDICGVRVC